MATHALGYAPEDPVCLVESCRRAIEWILITHAAHGRLVPRPWIDHPYGEDEITLLEEELLPAMEGRNQLYAPLAQPIWRLERLAA